MLQEMEAPAHPGAAGLQAFPVWCRPVPLLQGPESPLPNTEGSPAPLVSKMKNFPKFNFKAKVLQVSHYFPRGFF